MFTNILVAYEDSPEAANALQAAIGIAQAFGARLCIATIVERRPIYLSFATSATAAINWREDRLRRCKSLEAQAVRKAFEANVPVDADTVRLDQTDSLLDCVRRHQADLFVYAVREHGGSIDLAFRNYANAPTCALMGISLREPF